MTKRVKVTPLLIIGVILITVALCAFLGKISGGFTKDTKDWVLQERNSDNLLSGTFDDYNAGNGVVVSRKNDGSLLLKGEYPGEGELVIPVETKTLAAGTYTLSGAPNGGNYTYYLRAKFGGTTVIADFGSDKGTFTLTESTSVDIELVVLPDQSFSNVRIYPVLVTGTTAGEFYK